jgi:hypothetical protein
MPMVDLLPRGREPWKDRVDLVSSLWVVNRGSVLLQETVLREKVEGSE